MHFFQFYFTKGVPETPKVSLKFNCFIVSGFQKSILNTSCKDPKVTSARYVTSGRPQDVNFEHKYKTHFCGIVFQFQFTKCLYQIIKSQLLPILLVLEKLPMNVLKTSQSDICSVTSLGHPQDVNLNIFHKIGFQGIFSIFPDTKGIPYIAEPKSLKNIKRTILVLLRSGTSRPKQDHKGVFSGHLCHLGNYDEYYRICIEIQKNKPHKKKSPF